MQTRRPGLALLSWGAGEARRPAEPPAPGGAGRGLPFLEGAFQARSSVQRTTVLADTSMPPHASPNPEPPSEAPFKFLTHRNHNMTDVYCLWPPSFGVICYTARAGSGVKRDRSPGHSIWGPAPRRSTRYTVCPQSLCACPGPDPVSGGTGTSVPARVPANSSLHVGRLGAPEELAPALAPRGNVRQSLSAHASTLRSQRWERLRHATVLSNQSRCQAFCQGCRDRRDATLVDEPGKCNSEDFWRPFGDL